MAVDREEPEALVAVSVYVVVEEGLTLVEPLAADEVKLPGVIATLVAPVVDQESVLLDPAFMLAGLALNELMVGADASGGGLDGGEFEGGELEGGELEPLLLAGPLEPPQLASVAHASRSRTRRRRARWAHVRRTQ